MKKTALLVVLTVLCSVTGYSQAFMQKLTGVVRDSATLEPLPYVYVTIKSKNYITTSDVDGAFSLSCSPGDTLVFTLLGYKTKEHVALSFRTPLMISLKETAYMLKSVTVYSNFKATGSDQWKNAVRSNNPFDNPTLRPSGGMQTFGVGGTVSGPFSYFSKAEKEKRKLKKMKSELAGTKVYRNALESPELKEYLKKLFSLTDEEYNKKIEQFNREFPDAARSKSEQEVKDLLVYFFSIKRE